MDYKRYALHYQWSNQSNQKSQQQFQNNNKKPKKKILAKYTITIFIFALSTILYIFPFVKNFSSDSIELVEEIDVNNDIPNTTYDFFRTNQKISQLNKSSQKGNSANNFTDQKVTQNFDEKKITNNQLDPQLDNDSEPEETIEENTTKDYFHKAHSFRVYYFKKGDNLKKIAKNYNISVDSVISLNGIRNKKDLFTGKLIKIPNLSGVYYYPSEKDTLKSISKKYKVKVFDIIRYNYNYLHDSNFRLEEDKVLFLPNAKISIFDKRKLFGTPKKFFDPLKKKVRISSPFGYRKHPILKKYLFHKGIDIPAKRGTPVYAVASGTVVEARRKGNYGKYIRIFHNDRIYYTCYAHLSRINVLRGQKIKKGQMIGRVGNTGLSTGPHLHFEVRRRKSPINPKKFLLKRI